MRKLSNEPRKGSKTALTRSRTGFGIVKHQTIKGARLDSGMLLYAVMQ
jgi:hypothetical protein